MTILVSTSYVLWLFYHNIPLVPFDSGSVKCSHVIRLPRSEGDKEPPCPPCWCSLPAVLSSGFMLSHKLAHSASSVQTIISCLCHCQFLCITFNPFPHHHAMTCIFRLKHVQCTVYRCEWEWWRDRNRKGFVSKMINSASMHKQGALYYKTHCRILRKLKDFT